MKSIGVVSCAFVLLLVGCGNRPSFKCASDAQCIVDGVQGVCIHPDNVCALPDGNCPSGYRYDKSAGSLAGQCAPGPTSGDMASAGGGGGGAGGGGIGGGGDMAGAPAPTVSSVSPSMGPSTGGIGVAVGGQNFSMNATVTIGGMPATVMASSSTSISVIVPAGAVGPASVVVTNADGQQATGQFIYYATSLKFTEPTPAMLQGSTTRAVIADFNKDTKPDVAVCVRDPRVPPMFGNLQLYNGNGDGTFTTGNGTGITRNANDLDVGDFNNDGKVDVAIAFSTSDATNQVGVLLGNGDGTFQMMKLVTLAPALSSIAVRDVTGDGKLDIVATSGVYMSSSVVVLAGNGDGTFAASPKVSAIDLRGNMNAQACGFALADFTGDTILDAAVAMGSGASVAILIGNGDGTFRTNTTNLSTGTNATQVVIAGDWNKDTKADLAIEVANQTGTINIQLGNGDGTFGTPNPMPGAAGSFQLATGDFNNDGIADIASSGYTYNGQSAVGVLQGKGDGTFMVQATPVVTGNPVGLAVGDFNKDNKLDIVAPTDQGKLTVMLNASQ